MPRQPRIEHEGAIYHLINRGDRREDIVCGDADRELFVLTLGETCVKCAASASCWPATSCWKPGDPSRKSRSASASAITAPLPGTFANKWAFRPGTTAKSTSPIPPRRSAPPTRTGAPPERHDRSARRSRSTCSRGRDTIRPEFPNSPLPGAFPPRARPRSEAILLSPRIVTPLIFVLRRAKISLPFFESRR